MRQQVHYARRQEGPRAVPQGVDERGGWLLLLRLLFVWLYFAHERLPPTSRWAANRPVAEGESANHLRQVDIVERGKIAHLPLLTWYRLGLPGEAASTRS